MITLENLKRFEDNWKLCQGFQDVISVRCATHGANLWGIVNELIAEIRRLRATELQWTETPPAAAEQYWFVQLQIGNPRVVDVFLDRNCDPCITIAGNPVCQVERLGGYWAGPIVAPSFSWKEKLAEDFRSDSFNASKFIDKWLPDK